jgi:hypothetical protein
VDEVAGFAVVDFGAVLLVCAAANPDKARIRIAV